VDEETGVVSGEVAITYKEIVSTHSLCLPDWTFLTLISPGGRR
jgi:hypothetical protein